MNSYCTRVLSAAVLTALGAFPLRAQAPADTLSLPALLAAVEAAPVVEAARLSAEAARARTRGTGLRPDPEVSAMLWPGSLAVGMGEALMLQATQPLPYPSQLRREREAAEAMADVAETGVAVAAAERRLVVRLAYYGLYRAQAREVLVRAFQRRLEAFAEAAAVRYEVGRGTQGAVLQGQLEAARLDEELLTLATMRHEGLVTLSALLGRPVPAHHHAGDAPPRAVVVLLPVPSVADTALVAHALRQRPELAALDAEARAAEAEAAVARLAFRPEVGVTAGLRFMGLTLHHLAAAPGVGAMVRLPL
ncbi:MAG TPA: TolC family protein, partial [Rhodothermales bacterium]|nr:TolC family protein [Rhodothermales bacterium]